MRNRILNAIPPKEYLLLEPHLRLVTLEQGTLLLEAGDEVGEVFLPEDCVVSYLSGTTDGETLEVCVIGNEGAVGLSAIASDSATFRAVVQIPGAAYAIDPNVLRQEFKRCENLHRVVLQYTNALLVQIAQTAVCNKFHSVEERFCRWLLMVQDRLGTDQIPLTQEALARLLGTRRASVSITAGATQKEGAIEYRRGVIRILDRTYLEKMTCECYQTISAAHRNK